MLDIKLQLPSWRSCFKPALRVNLCSSSPDTLVFENEDHAYGQIEKAKLVPGDPLQVIRSLAKQVAAKGIKRINGRVVVDVSLFPEGTREAGSGVAISPVSVNDNVIDVREQCAGRRGPARGV